MAKTTRAQAEAEVLRLSERLSATLLAAELRCFARVDKLFRDGRVTPTVATLAQLRNSADEKAALVDGYSAVLRACVGPVWKLAREAGNMARDSIAVELLHVERSLPKKHAGITGRAMAGCDPVPYADAGMLAYRTQTAAFPRRYQALLVDQLRQAVDLSDLEDRLYSDRPSKGRGRGVWVQSSALVHQQARWVSIAVANAVRLDGMRRFNAEE
jgi:hypothetical protein